MEIVVPQSQVYDVDVFSHKVESICGAFEVFARTQERRIAGFLSAQHCGGLDIAQIGIDAKKVTRSARDIERDPGDHYFLILQHQGVAGIIQGDKENWLEPGDMCIVDSSKPSLFQFDDGYSAQISVHLPRQEMSNRFGRRISGGVNIAKEDPLGLAMRSILAKLLVEGAQATNCVREAFFSVLGAYLTERAEGERSINPDREIIRRCIAVMSDNFRDPEFTSASAAELTGVSLRRLQRAFRLIEETPHSRLQSMRIEHAYTAICGKRDTTVSAIAFGSGFNDLSTFYRCFKARYSTSPKAQFDHV